MLTLMSCICVLIIAAPIMLAAVISVYLHTVGPIVCECVVTVATDTFNWVRDAIQSFLPSPETSDEFIPERSQP
jgi:hypothetical protein